MNSGLVILGFFVALFSSGIGVGGGTLYVPLLISKFGFDFRKAANTSLAAIIPISFVGSISYFIFLSDIPQLKYYVIFIPMCMLGAIAGGTIVHKYKNVWLKPVFSIFLLIVSLRMLNVFDLTHLIYVDLYGTFFGNEILKLIVTGLVIGIIAVFLGVGCGLLIVPFFVIAISLDIHEAIRLSLTTMFFLTLSVTVFQSKLKTLDTAPLKSLLLPALFGAIAGAMIASYLPDLILKKLFGLFLFVMACKFLFQIFYTRYKSKKYQEGKLNGH
ncbi:MAG: sulfite exporter TauE/SafE family protein [bacterium]